MKNLILLVLLLSVSCSKEKHKVEIVKIPLTNKEVFTLNQKYQISCWVIKLGEGYSATSYKCSAGKTTCGYGFTNVKSVKDIHHADKIFQKIVLKLFKQVNKAYPTLSYMQKIAIISLVYNTGSLEKIKNSGFSKALVANNKKEAIKKFSKWCCVKVNGKTIVIKGLQNRREFESKLLNDNFTMNDYLALKKQISNIYILNKTT